MSYWDNNDPLGSYDTFQAIDEQLDYDAYLVREALDDFDSRPGNVTWGALTSDEVGQIGALNNAYDQRERSIVSMRRSSTRWMP